MNDTATLDTIDSLSAASQSLGRSEERVRIINLLMMMADASDSVEMIRFVSEAFKRISSPTKE